MGVEVRDIQYLFLTHHHDDHAGFLNQLPGNTPLTITANRQSKGLLLDGKNEKSRGGGWVSPAIRLLAETIIRYWFWMEEILESAGCIAGMRLPACCSLPALTTAQCL